MVLDHSYRQLKPGCSAAKKASAASLEERLVKPICTTHNSPGLHPASDRALPSQRVDQSASLIPSEHGYSHESHALPSETGDPSQGPSGVTPLRSKLPPHPWPPAPLAPGVNPKAPKSANKVFETVVAAMLTEAQHKFECLLFVEDAYPGIDTQIRWSIECWEAICKGAGCFFELSKEMMSLVCIARCLVKPDFKVLTN